MPRGSPTTSRAHHKSLYALGVAFATYGVAVLPPHGNGFIAVFVCAITLGIRRPDLGRHFEERADDIVEIVKLGDLRRLRRAADLRRPVRGRLGRRRHRRLHAPVRPHDRDLDLTRGTRIDTATKGFMAWFGPKGVATMTFSILVLGQPIAEGERIFNLAALVVFCSIIVHGLSDTPGSEWLARRAERQ